MRKWLRLSVVLACAASAGWAVDWKALQPQGYVSDFAKVIDASSKARLEAYCAEVEQSTGAQMALVTIPSLEDEPIEEVANTIFRAWGVGQKGKNEGILLLLAINNRRDRLEVGYGLEPILPDGLDGSILREMRPALRNGDYGDALTAAAATIGSAIAGAKHVSIQTQLPRRARPHPSQSIPWPLIIGALVLIGWLMRAGGPRGYGGGGGGGGFLSGLLLGSAMNRGSWGGRGSGGFGGFDSGDGFGGFGGGDSGGGGASSDW
jgi:uncharacterized protein